MIKINEGFNFLFLIPTLALCIAACFLLLVDSRLFWLAQFILFHGYFIQSGVRLDPVNKRAQKYRQLYGVYWGSWKSMDHVQEAKLVLNAERTVQRDGSAGPLIRPGSFYGSTSFKTYDIHLYQASDQYVLYDFNEYRNARKCLESLFKMGIPCEDLVADKIRENQQRRTRKKRL
ncbi:MAG: hypothetical protein EP338_04210 [Bacteroidetes bacterium]|nr:MAG: hypothetical protein EP338_04210 [Bacteroidota bacterium]